MRAVLTIGANAVRRLLRDRSSLFFVFVFPLALILLLGLAFGGGQPVRLAVVATDVGPLGDELVAALEAGDNLVVDRYDAPSEAADAVSRGLASAAVLIPAGYDGALRAGRGVEVGFVGRADSSLAAVRTIVESTVARHASVLAAADLVSGIVPDVTYDDALDRARVILQALPGVEVQVDTVGSGIGEEFAGLGRFDLGASSQLILFMFLTSLSGAATLIQNRELGVTRRMLATPVSVRQVIAGEALGRFGVAVVQGLYIMVGTALLFSVNWGSWPLSLLVLATFGAASAAAAMVLGSVLRNQSQAGGVGVGLGIGLGALGGSMVPPELLPSGMQAVAHLTPHWWAIDALAEIIRHDGGLVDIAGPLVVLLAMAAGLLLVGAAGLRRRITQA